MKLLQPVPLDIFAQKFVTCFLPVIHLCLQLCLSVNKFRESTSVKQENGNKHLAIRSYECKLLRKLFVDRQICQKR